MRMMLIPAALDPPIRSTFDLNLCIMDAQGKLGLVVEENMNVLLKVQKIEKHGWRGGE